MHSHDRSQNAHPSRRDFFRNLTRTTLAGASVLELAYYRAAWARAQAPASNHQLFEIENVADGVYCAKARVQAEINCNAAIFVNSADVLVVDAHSKPSAAAALITQIKREITAKPVRHVVNTHFHWDHIQGDHAYRVAEKKVDFIASKSTQQLISDFAEARFKDAFAAVPKQIDTLQARADKSNSPAEKAYLADQIRQLRGYQAEMQNYAPELPTISFEKSYVLKDKAHELHIEFRGHAHTAGDVVVFCPQKRAIATGDMIIGFLPNIADGYPMAWPKTMDSVAQLDFASILPGHGPVQPSRISMTSERNYIEELTQKVADGKKAGKSVADLQKTITVNSLKSLQSNGYAEYLAKNQKESLPAFDSSAQLQNGLKGNIAQVYKNLDKV
jgi:glyoxylase-like metal-dependent hydrolase (beta-lactamase superfamily II)